MNPIFPYDDDARKKTHEIVDRLFDHVQNVSLRPVVKWTEPAELAAIASLENGLSFDEAVDELFDRSIQLHHPRYMGHQVCPPAPAAVVGDLLVSALNQSTAVWEMSPIATMIEKEIVRWLSAKAGYPADSLGTAVSGGSAANLTALLAARARWRNDGDKDDKTPVILCSADAHYSIARAASIMGITGRHVLKIPTDDRHRMNVDELEAALKSLEGSEMLPLAIVATSGSTATGAFDNLEEIALLRDRFRTWLHVDAAHGASVLLSDELKHLVHNLDRADSLSWDPHKMLWMPLSLGVVLVRNGAWLRLAFEADAPYLFHADTQVENIGQVTIQCSKRADAVKLWLVLRSEGESRIAAALERVTAMTRKLYLAVSAAPDFEAMHEPEFNIFCFRYTGVSGSHSDELLGEWNGAIRQRLIESGEAWITSTVLKGRRVLRVTMINPATEEADIERMLEAVRREGQRIAR